MRPKGVCLSPLAVGGGILWRLPPLPSHSHVLCVLWALCKMFITCCLLFPCNSVKGLESRDCVSCKPWHFSECQMFAGQQYCVITFIFVENCLSLSVNSRNL